MESSLRDELFKDLMNHDIDRLIVICEKYSRIFGLAKFYERVLTPVTREICGHKELLMLPWNVFVVTRHIVL